MIPFDKFFTGVGRAVNGLDIHSAVTMDRCWIFDSLTTSFKSFVNGLDIKVKDITILTNLMKFSHIFVAEYLI